MKEKRRKAEGLDAFLLLSHLSLRGPHPSQNPGLVQALGGLA